ncbi:hypothetical protein E1B28_006863 [Marasmius oreades]|uniref:Uncharacterized protein n=1 Tax=Marasmius oreades TaxID=181124 RepID=A0A9P7S0F8_9AGAR|nr:uncharacterized protein E1B28_006863 [Marasmius oreades]KAG7093174.1 hypothetical protein E1B28_006863 [Marasmius oreades]
MLSRSTSPTPPTATTTGTSTSSTSFGSTSMSLTTTSSSTSTPSASVESTPGGTQPPPSREDITDTSTILTHHVSTSSVTVVTTEVKTTLVNRPGSNGEQHPTTVLETITVFYTQSPTETETVRDSSTGLGMSGVMASGRSEASTSGTSTRIGEIIGAVVGGVLGIALIPAMLVVYYRRRKINRLSSAFDGDFDPYRVERAQSQRIPHPVMRYSISGSTHDLPTLPNIPLPSYADDRVHHMTRTVQYEATNPTPSPPYSPLASSSVHGGNYGQYADTGGYHPPSSPSKQSSPTHIPIQTRSDWDHPSPGPSICSLQGHGTTTNTDLGSHSHSYSPPSSMEHGSMVAAADGNRSILRSPTLDSSNAHGSDRAQSSSSQPFVSSKFHDHEHYSDDNHHMRYEMAHSPIPDAYAPGFGSQDSNPVDDGIREGHGSANGEGGGSGSGARAGRRKRLSVANPDPDGDVGPGLGDDLGGDHGGDDVDGERTSEGQRTPTTSTSDAIATQNEEKTVYAGGYDESAWKAYLESGPVLRRSMVHDGRDIAADGTFESDTRNV